MVRGKECPTGAGTLEQHCQGRRELSRRSLLTQRGCGNRLATFHTRHYQSDCTAFLKFLETFAVRLLTQALRRGADKGKKGPNLLRGVLGHGQCG
jgi:hypothetical protein